MRKYRMGTALDPRAEKDVNVSLSLITTEKDDAGVDSFDSIRTPAKPVLFRRVLRYVIGEMKISQVSSEMSHGHSALPDNRILGPFA